MTTSEKIHNFTLSQQDKAILLTAQEYPWSVLQVIPTTPEAFDRNVAAVQTKRGGFIAHHDTDRTFFIIHLTSGDHDGQHPERHLNITQANHEQILKDIQDTMAQAAVWYYTNVISRTR